MLSIPSSGWTPSITRCATTRAPQNRVPFIMSSALTRTGARTCLACMCLTVRVLTFGSVSLPTQNRGVRDILIACVDGLSGFPNAIQSVFPNTDVQLCIVHQIRNSVKYVGSKNQKEFLRDLKLVYAADTKEKAETELNHLEKKWGELYPVVIKSWRDKWELLSCYFQYTAAIRKIIYTTNTVEGYHRQVRKVTKTKSVFPTDDALYKLVYQAYRNIRKKWTMPLANWGQTAQQLAIKFGDRFKIM